MSIAFPMILISLGIFYYFVNPAVQQFPIQCPWHLLTGTQCPACGTQRALSALAHGHVSQALSYNYFFILSIPYALIAVLVSWYNYGHRLDGLKRIAFHPTVLKTYVVLFFAWWIVRNLLHI
ncbi:MAG: DUF2752 domain-containing protein [Muribaculaceae bacterium]|nr:DUF2752 domain-containing protein [Muribaculaceae bacterium]